jgi:hypothetical protein
MDSLKNGGHKIAALKERDLFPLVIVFIFMLAVFFLFRPGFRLDSFAYYDFTRSILFDGDINYYNERNFSPSPVHFGLRTATGFTNNIFPIGTGVLWLPPVSLYRAAGGCLTARDDPDIREGFTDDYFTVVCLSSALYVLFGLLLLHALLKRYVSGKSAFLAVVFMFFATPLLPFTLILPSFSHGASFFTVTLFLFLALKPDKRPALTLLCGLAAGLMVLVRLQNALFLIFPLFHIAGPKSGKKIPLASLFIFLSAFLSVFFVQLLTWKILNGSFFSMHSAAEDMSLLHQWAKPLWRAQLFHLRLGLFSFTPITLLGMAGLLAAVRAYPRFVVPAVLIFLMQLYINSTKADWYGVGLYGARRFISLVPFFAFGLSRLIESARHRRTWHFAVLLAAAGYCVLKNLASLPVIESGHLKTEIISLMPWTEAAGALFLSVMNPEGLVSFLKGGFFLSSAWHAVFGLCLLPVGLIVAGAFSSGRLRGKNGFPAVRTLAFAGWAFFVLLSGYLLYSRWDSRLVYTVDCRSDRPFDAGPGDPAGERLKKALGRPGLKGKLPMQKARAGAVQPLVIRHTAFYQGFRKPVRLSSGDDLRLTLDRPVKAAGLALITSEKGLSISTDPTGFPVVNIVFGNGRSIRQVFSRSEAVPAGRRLFRIKLISAAPVEAIIIRNNIGHPDILIHGLSLDARPEL